MRHYKTNGLYPELTDVWDFYSYAEMLRHKTDCSNWQYCLRDAKKYLGKRWHDNEVRYFINGHPVYKMYTIVGFCDNEAWADYYWIVRPDGVTDDSQDQYKLWNNKGFTKNIIIKKRKKKK